MSEFSLNTPAARGAMAGAAVAAALWVVKPPAFFNPETGRPRTASWAVGRPDLVYQSTPVPWYLAAAGVAMAVTLFV